MSNHLLYIELISLVFGLVSAFYVFRISKLLTPAVARTWMLILIAYGLFIVSRFTRIFYYAGDEWLLPFMGWASLLFVVLATMGLVQFHGHLKDICMKKHRKRTRG